MKITTISRLNSGLLLLVALALGLSLFIGIQHFNQPISKTQKFSEYKTFLNTQILTEISNYLTRGDATGLSNAETAVSELEDRLANQQDPGLLTLRELLTELKQFLTTEARAAGKLAGNEETLIIQNERETRDEISRLIDYSNDGASKNQRLAADYRSAAQELLFLLSERSMQRQQATLADSARFDGLFSVNRDMLAIIERVNQFERLGITIVEEEEDSFAALMGLANNETDTATTEDKAEDIIYSMKSLLTRFPREMEATLEIKERIRLSNERINTLIAQISSNIDILEKQMVAQFSATVELAKRFMIGMIVIIVLFTLVINYSQRRIAFQILRFVPYLETYAQGNLSQQVALPSLTQEIAGMRDSANTLRENLINLIGTIVERADKVLDISQRLHGASEHLASQMNRQTERTEKISESVDQMSIAFADIAQNTVKAADSSTDISNAAQEGLSKMESASQQARALATQVKQTSQEVTRLGDYANNIGAVLEVISSIAEQTNLLALNAAIEAARAGEHGRGFAVVADEVRSLSARTADSTVEIQEIIDQIQKQTNSCLQATENQVKLAQKTLEKNESANLSVIKVAEAIESIEVMTKQIAETTDRQSQQADSINTSIHDVKDSISEASTSSQATADLSEHLKAETHGLQMSVEAFKY